MISEICQFIKILEDDTPQIFEEGGLDSQPANQLGIVTAPTLILVDQDSKVVNRNLRMADLETEVKKLLR